MDEDFATSCCKLFCSCILACCSFFGLCLAIWFSLHIFIGKEYSGGPLTFRVDSLSVHPFKFNISNNSSRITANWSVIFSVGNPESCRRLYGCYVQSLDMGDVNVSLLYMEQNISSMVTLYPKYFEHERTTLINATVDVASRSINSSVADAIVEKWTSIRAVNFTIEVDAIAETADTRYRLEASCEEIKVDFSPNMTAGTMLGGSRRCNARLNLVLLINLLHLFINSTYVTIAPGI